MPDVIPVLVTGIRFDAHRTLRGTMGPGNKCRDDRSGRNLVQVS